MDQAPTRRTVIRTPQPPLARPAEFVRHAWHDLRRSRRLAVELAKRELRRQYREGLLGPVTSLLAPLIMTGIGLGFRNTGILHAGSGATPYALFVLAGVILWITFLDAVYAPVHGLLAEQRLLARANAPLEAILLGKLGPVLTNALIRGLLFALAVLWYAFPLPVTVVLAPMGFASLIALGTAIGLLIAPLILLYRNISAVLAAAMTLWFIFSPVYFPAPAEGAVGRLMSLNPLTPLLSDTRALMLLGGRHQASLSALVALAAVVLLLASWLYARIVLPVVIEQANE